MYQWRKITYLGSDYSFATILFSDKGDRAMVVAPTGNPSKSSYIVISDDYGNIYSFKGTLNQNAADQGFITPVMSGDGNVMGFVNRYFDNAQNDERCKSCKSLNLYRIDYKSKSVKAVNHANGTRWNGIASNYKGDKIILAEYNQNYYLMQNKSLKKQTNEENIFISNSPNFPPNYVQNMKLTKSGNELYGFFYDGNKSTLIRQDVSKTIKGVQSKFTWHKSFNFRMSDYAISSNAKSIAVASGTHIYQSGDKGNNWTKSSKAFVESSSITMSSDGQYRCVFDRGTFPKPVGYFYTSNDYGKSWIKETQVKGSGGAGSVHQAMSANGDFIYIV